MIIIGYPCIGKSSISNSKTKCIDLESGNFWIKSDDGKQVRDEHWFISYCNIAEDLSRQGYIVFVAAHDLIQKQLESSNEQVYIICPSIAIRDKWVERLKMRYISSGLDKDLRALSRAENNYFSDIEKLIQTPKFQTYIISDINYDLLDIIETIVEDCE